MIVDAVEPFLQHHLLSMYVEAVREVLRHWITNRPSYHCYPGSDVQIKTTCEKGRLMVEKNGNK